ncbi:MAG: magnesium and cobalt transport protein CorA [Dehalococcoidia bacterium]|nr:MAG: magnesium and cobalt transport protein CorA [Dehalococcoidia bacterium]
MRETKRSKKAGLPPGTLVHIGREHAEATRISLIDYTETQFQEKTIDNIEDTFPFRDSRSVTWINIDGLHDTSTIEKIGNHFGLHPLIQEDIVNTEQRPKIEDFGSYIFIVLRMLDYDVKRQEIKNEQVSLVLGSNFVLSFQEDVGDVWDGLRERIRKNKGHIRKEGADYLAYSLMDAIVDNYFIILEKAGENIEDIEEELITAPSRETLPAIYRLKREMLVLRKAVWPLREVANTLEHGENPVIKDSTRIYLRDIYDHAIQVIDTIENYREMITTLVDVYLSSVSNRLNEIVKVLTILSSIFIPLTFIVGVYGMNFAHMPELDLTWAYPALLVFMAFVALSMVAYFKRKKWF